MGGFKPQFEPYMDGGCAVSVQDYNGFRQCFKPALYTDTYTGIKACNRHLNKFELWRTPIEYCDVCGKCFPLSYGEYLYENANVISVKESLSTNCPVCKKCLHEREVFTLAIIRHNKVKHAGCFICGKTNVRLKKAFYGKVCSKTCNDIAYYGVYKSRKNKGPSVGDYRDSGFFWLYAACQYINVGFKKHLKEREDAKRKKKGNRRVPAG